MSIYFDNAATTIIDKDVLMYINDFNINMYANPSAMHKYGFLVEQEVKNASSVIAKIINSEMDEIIWTSGGSESNNLAIKGYMNAYGKRYKHLITTKIEHPSVLKVFQYLENEGYDVTYLDVNSDGQIDIDVLKNSIRSDTALVSIMYVNNEIGAVQNIDAIGKCIKEKNMNTAFHVDFVQGFGKYKIDVKKSKIDFLSISSHKFNGPKGVGVLYKNKNIRILPEVLGGGQQSGLRAGTLNAPGIVGTRLAAEIAYRDFDQNVNKMRDMRDYLIDKLDDLNAKHKIITKNTKKSDIFAPHIVSVSFKGIRAEVLLHSLDEKGIYVSAGSACSSHDKKISSTLVNIGLKNDLAESTIRISFGKYNEKDEINEFVDTLDSLIGKLLL